MHTVLISLHISPTEYVELHLRSQWGDLTGYKNHTAIWHDGGGGGQGEAHPVFGPELVIFRWHDAVEPCDQRNLGVAEFYSMRYTEFEMGIISFLFSNPCTLYLYCEVSSSVHYYGQSCDLLLADWLTGWLFVPETVAVLPQQGYWTTMPTVSPRYSPIILILSGQERIEQISDSVLVEDRQTASSISIGFNGSRLFHIETVWIRGDQERHYVLV